MPRLDVSLRQYRMLGLLNNPEALPTLLRNRVEIHPLRAWSGSTTVLQVSDAHILFQTLDSCSARKHQRLQPFHVEEPFGDVRSMAVASGWQQLHPLHTPPELLIEGFPPSVALGSGINLL